MAPNYRLSRIDDPEGGSTVLGLRGMVNEESIDALRAEIVALTPPHAVYFDFTRAVILAGPAMTELAELIDEIESRQLCVKVVGITPTHPALRQLTDARPDQAD